MECGYGISDPARSFALWGFTSACLQSFSVTDNCPGNESDDSDKAIIARRDRSIAISEMVSRLIASAHHPHIPAETPMGIPPQILERVLPPDPSGHPAPDPPRHPAFRTDTSPRPTRHRADRRRVPHRAGIDAPGTNMSEARAPRRGSPCRIIVGVDSEGVVRELGGNHTGGECAEGCDDQAASRERLHPKGTSAPGSSAEQAERLLSREPRHTGEYLAFGGTLAVRGEGLAFAGNLVVGERCLVSRGNLVMRGNILRSAEPPEYAGNTLCSAGTSS